MLANSQVDLGSMYLKMKLRGGVFASISRRRKVVNLRHGPVRVQVGGVI